MVEAQVTLPLLAPLALWTLGWMSLLFLLAGLCAICHRKGQRKRKPVPQEGVKLVDVSLLRQIHLRSLSKSDTKLHELNRVQSSSSRAAALRPASMDFLYPSWPRGPQPVSRLTTAAPPDFSHREPPRFPTAAAPPDPDPTYSNVGLAVPSVAPGDSPNVEKKSGGAEALGGAVFADYACVRKVKKGAEEGPDAPALPQRSSSLRDIFPKEGTAQQPKVTQVEVVYSRVNKTGRKPPACDGAAESLPAGQLNPKGSRGTQTQPAMPTRDRVWSPSPDPAYETIAAARGPTPEGPALQNRLPENLYESIREMRGQGPRNPGSPGPLGEEMFCVTQL
ncbi:lck-interacting transmembrane adapter 1 [Ornithorhynchus anatinus]|uniref:Lck interacting transmembrane adaptor 1 n=1 Tax=Ornithorhynchus anatinus TaxID=9258 RepID=A0A6I8NZJ0_ORNAN|nr:lck-interacting transmembrane adapter 1 [Ornithorhynchus anatinus]